MCVFFFYRCLDFMSNVLNLSAVYYTWACVKSRNIRIGHSLLSYKVLGESFGPKVFYLCAVQTVQYPTPCLALQSYGLCDWRCGVSLPNLRLLFCITIDEALWCLFVVRINVNCVLWVFHWSVQRKIIQMLTKLPSCNWPNHAWFMRHGVWENG